MNKKGMELAWSKIVVYMIVILVFIVLIFIFVMWSKTGGNLIDYLFQ